MPGGISRCLSVEWHIFPQKVFVKHKFMLNKVISNNRSRSISDSQGSRTANLAETYSTDHGGKAQCNGLNSRPFLPSRKVLTLPASLDSSRHTISRLPSASSICD